MVELIDIETGAALTTFTEAANWSSDIDFSPDGTLLAAGGQFGEVLIWRSDGTVVDRLVGHGGPVDAVEFSPDGSFVVSGSADGTVRRWLLTT
jgi:WD40 repeat protein